MKPLDDHVQSNGRDPLQSMTVDVFDTVLLRTIWPEERQFRIVAGRWLSDVRSVIDPSITEYELVSFRKYARKVYWLARKEELRRCEKHELDHEIDIGSWFELLVDMLITKYGKSVITSEVAALVDRMITHEIDVEKENTGPNHRLIRAIDELKNRHNLRVYFCSDIYLTSAHVEQLLEHHKITVFDGGVTSADRRKGKWSGKLFRALETNGIPHRIDLTTNLHIGDDPKSDFLVPLREGSRAVLYSSFHHRRRSIMRAIGRWRYQRYEKTQKKLVIDDYRRRFADDSIGVRLGSMFAPAAIAFVHRVERVARLNRSIRYIAASSEARVIEKLMITLESDTPDNVFFAPKVNRKSLFRELVSTVVLSNDTPRINALSKLMVHAEGPGDDFDLLRLFDDDFGELVASKMDDDTKTEFIFNRLKELIGCTHESGDCESGHVQELLDRDHITIVDVGWLGTIQVLIREIATFTDTKPRIEGIYLGSRSVNPFGIDRGRMEGLVFPDTENVRDRPFFIPEIWEFVLSSSSDSQTPAKSRAIFRGLEKGTEFWRASLHCSPADFFDAMRPELMRLFVDPAREEMLYLGTIEWTTGFTKESTKQLVDFGHHRTRKLVKGLVQPRKSVRDVTNLGPQSWPAAYVKFYRIGHLRPVLRHLGRKRGVFYG